MPEFDFVDGSLGPTLGKYWYEAGEGVGSETSLSERIPEESTTTATVPSHLSCWPVDLKPRTIESRVGAIWSLLETFRVQGGPERYDISSCLLAGDDLGEKDLSESAIDGSGARAPGEIGYDGDLALRVARVVGLAKGTGFEGGIETDFDRELADLIDTFGPAGVDAVWNEVIAGGLGPSLTEEILAGLGRLESPATMKKRAIVLRNALFSPIDSVRSGAVIGLAFLEESSAFLEALKIASRREPIDWIRKDMEDLFKGLGSASQE